MSPGDLVVTRWGARFRGRTFPCAVGRGGVAVKRAEGDGITPSGVWRISEVWYRPDRLRMPGRAIGLRDAWCDDPADPRYNTRILRDQPGGERLRRADPLYDAVAVLDYNSGPVVPGMGSAIFIHCWRRPGYPTAGCVAFRRDHMAWILARLGSHTRIIIR